MVDKKEYKPEVVICEVAVLWASLSVSLFVSAYLVTEIMAQKLGQKKYSRDFVLMAYSSCAAYIIIIIYGLFPFDFFRLLFVLGVYSYYLYWIGIPYLVQTKDSELKTFYGLLSLFIMIITYLLMFFLFDKIFEEIFVK